MLIKAAVRACTTNRRDGSQGVILHVVSCPFPTLGASQQHCQPFQPCQGATEGARNPRIYGVLVLQPSRRNTFDRLFELPRRKFKGS